MFQRFSDAIIYNNNIFSYEQFMGTVNYMSAYLDNYMTNKNIIAIALNRSPELVIVVFAMLSLNIPFLLIDINMPTERLNKMAREASIDVIVTSHNVDIELKNTKKIFIDDLNIDLRQNKSKSISANETMYVLFTSGSTGTPKGVEITSSGFINFVEGVSEIIDFSPGKRIACLTTVSFDIFFLESIMALQKGLTVVLANEDEQRNPKLMAKLIQYKAVDMVQMTPSRMQLLLNHDKELSCLKNVKEIMIGGEPFPLSLLRELQVKTTAKIYNMYGPTETTIWSTISDLTHKDKIDIGHPIKNTEIYIVDESLYTLPNGQVGEICIAGKGLAKGYIGRNDLTVEKFVSLPQSQTG